MRTTTTAAFAAVALLLGLGHAVACEIEPADRQLRLAEADLDAGSPERAADAAASALRLDPACTQAMFVRGLALHRFGRADEARALLVAYRDLRGTLELDPRFDLTLGLIELGAADAQGDHAERLRLADLALTGLELEIAEELLGTDSRKEWPAEASQRRLELLAQLHWARADMDAAERTWRQLFAEHPDAAVDSELPPDQLTVMARAQEAVRAAGGAARPSGSSPTPLLIIAGLGGAATAGGSILAGTQHQRGLKLQPLLSEPNGFAMNVDTYEAAQQGERAGVAMTGVGAAVLVGGLVGALVHEAERRRLAKRRVAGAPEGPRR